MAIIPWRPGNAWWAGAGRAGDIRDELDRLFDVWFAGPHRRESGLLEGVWSPAIDVYDSADSLLVRADVPGMSREDIEVTVEGDTLTIRGEKKRSGAEAARSMVRKERFYGSFNRSVTLPNEIDSDRVSAVYRDGVLELTLPKKEESRPKQVRIAVEQPAG